MASTKCPVFPSNYSAFSLPKVQSRPNIQPSPCLCKKLNFGTSVIEKENNVNAVCKEIEKNKTAFFQRWNFNCFVTIKHEQKLAASSIKSGETAAFEACDPIITSKETIQVLPQAFQAQALVRPKSPLPFLASNSSCGGYRPSNQFKHLNKKISFSNLKNEFIRANEKFSSTKVSNVDTKKNKTRLFRHRLVAKQRRLSDKHKQPLITDIYQLSKKANWKRFASCPEIASSRKLVAEKSLIKKKTLSN